MYLVQILALAIYALVMIGALKDFKRTVLVWVPMSLLFNPQVCVWYNSPITALTVAVDLSLVLFYFAFKNGKFKSNGFNDERFFFGPAISIMLVSYVLATLFSEISFSSSINKLIKQSVDFFGIIYIIFRCLNTKDDVMIFFKSLVIAALIFCTNGIIEGILHENLWGDFVFFNSRCDETTMGRGWHIPNALASREKMRFGMIRCYSFFQLHLVYGYACCLVLYVVLLLKREKEQLFEGLSGFWNNAMYLALFGMLALSIIFCNSKGPMIMAILILLTNYQFKDLFKPIVIAPLIGVIVAIAVYFPDYILNFVSLLDENVADEGGGSTIDMRKNQLDIALSLFSNNPLFGNGINSSSYFANNGFEDLGGAESVWLKILPDQGLLGVMAYLFYYVKLKNGIVNIIPKKVWMFFFLAIFVFDCTNGKPFQTPIWWISVLFAVRRYYQTKKQLHV